MKGIEKYWHATMLLTLPNLLDSNGAASIPMPNVTLPRADITPICPVVALNLNLKNKLKSGTIKPAPKPMRAVGIINLTIA